MKNIVIRKIVRSKSLSSAIPSEIYVAVPRGMSGRAIAVSLGRYLDIDIVGVEDAVPGDYTAVVDGFRNAPDGRLIRVLLFQLTWKSFGES